jgi:acyl-CoA thioesterase FadM
MSVVSLADLERSGCAQTEGPRLRVRVPTDWPAEGEKRIGYVSILRLIESVRELHWRLDVKAHADPARVDSITRTLTADFVGPVIADTQIVCDYDLTWVRSRSYGLRVTLSDEGGNELATVELTNVFVDPGTLRPIAPDPVLTAMLRTRVRRPEEKSHRLDDLLKYLRSLQPQILTPGRQVTTIRMPDIPGADRPPSGIMQARPR